MSLPQDRRTLSGGMHCNADLQLEEVRRFLRSSRLEGAFRWSEHSHDALAARIR